MSIKIRKGNTPFWEKQNAIQSVVRDLKRKAALDEVTKRADVEPPPPAAKEDITSDLTPQEINL